MNDIAKLDVLTTTLNFLFEVIIDNKQIPKDNMSSLLKIKV